MTDSQVASLVVPQEERAYSATGSEAAAELPRMDDARPCGTTGRDFKESTLPNSGQGF